MSRGVGCVSGATRETRGSSRGRGGGRRRREWTDGRARRRSRVGSASHLRLDELLRAAVLGLVVRRDVAGDAGEHPRAYSPKGSFPSGARRSARTSARSRSTVSHCAARSFVVASYLARSADMDASASTSVAMAVGSGAGRCARRRRAPFRHIAPGRGDPAREARSFRENKNARPTARFDGTRPKDARAISARRFFPGHPGVRFPPVSNEGGTLARPRTDPARRARQRADQIRVSRRPAAEEAQAERTIAGLL